MSNLEKIEDSEHEVSKPMVEKVENASLEIIDDRSEEDRRCGFGCCSPEWIQVFASKKAFLVIFSILGTLQGMGWAYFTATITTIEKRFKISSETAGIVMTGNEISQVLFALVLSYYGAKGHRPRWIAIGVFLSGVSYFILASPHALYGPGSDALSLTEEYGDIYDKFNPLSTNDSFTDAIANTSNSAAVRNKVQTCRRDSDGSSGSDDCATSDTSIVPLILIFLSQFVLGIGILLFFSLGGPYLDDNVKNTKTPFVFGLTMALRLIGPTAGFIVAGSCLKVYISPWLTPIITPADPRWLGAWWLGWIFLGSVMVCTSVFIAMFPRQLPRTTMRKKTLHAASSVRDVTKIGSHIELANVIAEDKMPKLRELPKAIKRLMLNKVNMFNSIAGTLYLFSSIGYWTYMPKYMETVFRLTAANASTIVGSVSIGFQSIGLLVSGALITKYRPSARQLAAYNILMGFAYVAVKASFTQMGCDQGNLVLGTQMESKAWNITTPCNSDCNCKVNKMYPVCFKDTNQVFYSACHAGCTSFDNDTISNCSCHPNPTEIATVGTCADQGQCYNTLIIFLIVSAVIRLFDSGGRVGNMLISYRCVNPEEKSLAIGIGIFLTSLFAFLPSPIVFGQIYDSVCLIWGTKCGQRGNCWLYDATKLRYVLNLTAAAFTFMGTLFDCLVWYYVKDLDLYDEQKNVAARAEAEKENRKLKTQPLD